MPNVGRKAMLLFAMLAMASVVACSTGDSVAGTDGVERSSSVQSRPKNTVIADIQKSKVQTTNKATPSISELLNLNIDTLPSRAKGPSFRRTKLDIKVPPELYHIEASHSDMNLISCEKFEEKISSVSDLNVHLVQLDGKINDQPIKALDDRFTGEIDPNVITKAFSDWNGYSAIDWRNLPRHNLAEIVHFYFYPSGFYQSTGERVSGPFFRGRFEDFKEAVERNPNYLPYDNFQRLETQTRYTLFQDLDDDDEVPYWHLTARYTDSGDYHIGKEPGDQDSIVQGVKLSYLLGYHHNGRYFFVTTPGNFIPDDFKTLGEIVIYAFDPDIAPNRKNKYGSLGPLLDQPVCHFKLQINSPR